MRWLMIVLLCAGVARADGEIAGKFDYYVLSLSWSPGWCATTGDARKSPQCDPRHDHGWVLHGLWPQYERGWPSYCRTPHRPPTRAQTAAMADIMGTAGAAWHQWKKHGTCSGLSSEDYFSLARDAYEQITRPAVLRRLDKPVRLPAHVIEQAFLKDNPPLHADGLTITCKAGRIEEARLCLTRTLEPRICGADTRNDCRMQNAVLDPVR